MSGTLKTLIVSVVFALAMIGISRACGIAFWPALAIYLLGNVMAHVARWVDP